MERKRAVEKHEPSEMRELETGTARGSPLEEVKEGEKMTDPVNKPKEGSKQNPSKAMNHTIPRPFLLATEKRMSQQKRAPVDLTSGEGKRSLTREKRGSLDSKELQQPKSSHSVSLRK